ncbi:glutathione peroxidase [Belliella kenyensis]|uniref:Glutathione peroxidase n=1 Tax=Belliella kenyensis TaxID=1472724 RepID=A0ABV8EGX1_9BACT|nr:glutathione peroxidase [Belliella kenyensis]MCH7401798.1 glutathione peroxidase [Belliella kenyensis]MDN3604297.1 glutathione peroxidase [Belliella kenyensis]
MENKFYDFTAEDIKGQKQSMEQYKGRVVLVVNTASKCGFTPQFEGLEKLHRKYKDQGLVILGFPCNQFGGQDPGSDGEIEEFCQINYGVSFPMFSKVDVNGDAAHPLFKYLKGKLKGGLFGSKIKWNFTKFLLDSNGRPVKRYSSLTKPEAIEKDIAKLLKKK